MFIHVLFVSRNPSIAESLSTANYKESLKAKFQGFPILEVTLFPSYPPLYFSLIPIELEEKPVIVPTKVGVPTVANETEFSSLG